MRLVEALQLANSSQQGPQFKAFLACGFTPLHLETALKAHLRLALPDRTIEVATGPYGDLARTLETADAKLDVVIVVTEWSDLDPRLGWRTMSAVDGAVLVDAEARLGRILGAIKSIARTTCVIVALPGLDIPPVFHTSSWELHSVEAQLRQMVCQLGNSNATAVLRTDCLPQPRHDLRTELMNGFPYAFEYTDALASGLVRLLLPPVPKKGLITDLDETLWSGVLGDDGPEGISWDLDRKTQFHTLYQQLLNILAQSGALIGAASKNDETLVRTALQRPDLIVNPQHLFPIEAHWHSKAGSIARILEMWNIASDSVVFVDDNPLEIEQVKAEFPQLDCLLFRKDDPEFLVDLRDRFAKRVVREEDALRTSSLRAGQVLREREAGDGSGLEELLKGADAKVVFRWGKHPPDPRALELVNKTNQFNLNGKRYAEADWKRFISTPTARLIVAEYEDRFGKLGKIAVIAGQVDSNAFRVESWVMSCRAFSRRIEHQCLRVMLHNWETITMRYEQTERNGPFRNFLSELRMEATTIDRVQFERFCPPLFHHTESING